MMSRLAGEQLVAHLVRIDRHRHQVTVRHLDAARAPPHGRNHASVEADQSLPKYSDFPDTPEVGDETLLTTGGPDWLWVLFGLLAMLAGLIAIFEGRRKRRRRVRIEQRRQMRAEFRRT